MTIADASHVAYSDETCFNIGRYRGLGLISLESTNFTQVNKRILELLRDSAIREFKWEKLKTARYRFAALKLLDFAIEYVLKNLIRIDILVWDIEDNRHKIMGRCDNKNLQVMYYHLLKNVLVHRWPCDCTWCLYPDENSVIDWDRIKRFLDRGKYRTIISNYLFSDPYLREKFITDYRILRINPSRSGSNTLIQLSDLFVGLAVYSRESFNVYKKWEKINGNQMFLPGIIPGEPNLSNADKERCLILNELNNRCKISGMGVSLDNSRGLRTYDPNRKLNFWWYMPQHENDKAPRRFN
ncbi:MAG: hypothetical protein APR54_02515 [Candidatus Cloacimonas sp. SDB]|nr:MAG: hypothetical protein APR54_02515 [Candidatus Cloacimonas sp. SDB]